MLRSSCSIDWEKLRNGRIRRLVEQMEKEDLDAVFLQGIENVKYVTDALVKYSYFLWTNYSVLLLKDGNYIYFCPDFEVKANNLFCPWIKFIYPVPAMMYFEEHLSPIKRAIVAKNLQKGRIGLDFPVYQIYKLLRDEFPSVELIDAITTLDKVRSIKSEEELKAIEETVIVAEMGMKAALDTVKEGRKLYDIALSAEKTMRAEGTEYFPSYVASGKFSGSGIESYLNKRIRNGDLVYIDIGCVLRGYIAEFTRTTSVGKPSEEQRKIYQTVFKAEQNMIKMLKPGIKTKEADKAAFSTIKDAGYEKEHASGHGIGVGYHEPPIIGGEVDKDMEFKAGMVCCVEPGAYDPKIGGARLEDIVAIKEHETVVLTKTEYCDRLL